MMVCLVLVVEGCIRPSTLGLLFDYSSGHSYMNANMDIHEHIHGHSCMHTWAFMHAHMGVHTCMYKGIHSYMHMHAFIRS
ncbi:hypothetical protein SLEP1_g49459 [Rubroshorea leprosula]|uniref:Secreted protein n=1 Tax=Rubroshorea leprosula TaxID=152421 RepID=A0AAV5M056_9ROSI|nr:hypothetical protein SLEP1_g49459 [Rubroshorea leprosula]